MYLSRVKEYHKAFFSTFSALLELQPCPSYLIFTFSRTYSIIIIFWIESIDQWFLKCEIYICTTKNVANNSSTEAWYQKETFLWICLTKRPLFICKMIFFHGKQRQNRECVYCAGLRLIHNLCGWNDYVTLVLAKDRSFLKYV
jgi:hypothetical protein